MTQVLIAEDHEENRNLLKMMLEANGYRVMAAGDGLEALAGARRDPPDVIVSDVLMPKMDGFALCRAWMEDARLRDIPFIFYSATNVRPEDEQFGVALGAVRYLIKPLEAKVFLEELRAVLRQRTGQSAPAAASPLDEVTFHALHGSALARKIEDKVAQLEAANRKLQESEARFRALAELSSDWYWEQDADFRFTLMSGGVLNKGNFAVNNALGKTRWELPIELGAAEWAAHRATLEAHRAFTDFEYKIVTDDGSARYYSARGEPLFDPQGTFKGYRGTANDITERRRRDEDLRRFRAAMDATADAIYLVDRASMHFIDVNEAACRMQSRTREELLALGPDGILSISRAELERAYDAVIANGGRTEVLERKRLRQDGTPIWLELQRSAQRSDQGWTIVTVARDITERKTAEARITHLNRVYAVLSGINTLIVRVHDRDELFREACRIAVEAGGFRMALIAIEDRSAMKIVPVASAGKDAALLTAIKGILSSADDSPKTMVARALREKTAVVSNDSQCDPQVLFGKQYIESGVRSMVVLPLLVADEAAGVLALYAGEIEFFHEEEMKLLTELAGDIAFAIDHIGKQERLDYLAYYDVLTGLANRSLFLERVTQYTRVASRGGHKLAVFLIDLERFKNINDGLGQPAGDALLRQVAVWLTLNTGDANLLARIGADHFALVLPDVKQGGDGARLLDKMIKVFMDHPFRLNDAVFRIAVKVGVAVFPDDGADADTLFSNAETALKKAKASGERYLFYTQKMTDSVAGKLSLENRLRLALDDEEFVLHYQPKVNLVSGKVTSAEALIRWNDPRTGLVPPGRFIPILEETGMIYDVGRWALKKAIEDYLRWRAVGLPAVRIAVNVSALQLRNRGFIEEIRQVIGIDAQAPAGLELEITESLIMADVKGTIASLQAIRALGVSVAIDDFGTGFSSLAYLAKLPMDALKIDRSFVIDMTTAPEGLALVSTIIKLAHSLKLTVVAEGVETEEQARLLRLLACDEMQGFLFSKPIPSELFETRFLVPLAIE